MMKLPFIVDFHTHCLPQMDDGAVDTAESLAMLERTVEQGIHAVVATPHFYACEEQSTEDFLHRREQRLQQLREAIDTSPSLAGNIRMTVGAEVLVQEGISRLPLEQLCIAGTNLLMLELPFSPPPMWLYEELEKIAFDKKLRVLFAHLDRYQPWYTQEQIGELLELPDVWVQLNGCVLQSRRAVSQMTRWLPRKATVVLGSDMHHAEQRGQNLGRAMRHLHGHAVGRGWLDCAAAISRRMMSP